MARFGIFFHFVNFPATINSHSGYSLPYVLLPHRSPILPQLFQFTPSLSVLDNSKKIFQKRIIVLRKCQQLRNYSRFSQSTLNTKLQQSNTASHFVSFSHIPSKKGNYFHSSQFLELSSILQYEQVFITRNCFNISSWGMGKMGDSVELMGSYILCVQSVCELCLCTREK